MSSDVLTALFGVALAAWALFVVAERRTRPRWTERVARRRTVGSPYRAMTVTERVGERAPRLVRAAAFTGIVLGSVAVPAAIWALVTLRLDSRALALLPALASVAGSWCAGWLLLARRPLAIDFFRFAVLASQASCVMLVALGLLQLLAVLRLGASERAPPQYVTLAIALAITTFPHATLLRWAMARHARAFDGRPEDPDSTSTAVR